MNEKRKRKNIFIAYPILFFRTYVCVYKHTYDAPRYATHRTRTYEHTHVSMYRNCLQWKIYLLEHIILLPRKFLIGRSIPLKWCPLLLPPVLFVMVSYVNSWQIDGEIKRYCCPRDNSFILGSRMRTGSQMFVMYK